ncbi:ABC transporter ATP-binding protein [Clostridium tepidum]|uniref:ABC transporter domain-containing protein n=1 Tax=Clostridium tepidum TaxID=1962263 RepID=A0ABX3L3J7_9CLOT|nr:ATP-binding cassette domain-containing protein [Clostridium tepidum]MDU6877530.1 ATP-binding cassette domain-containing protein [Clostridium botulinum]OOO62097.1 hypothetical protein BS637_08185 [Clostridium tepidum]
MILQINDLTKSYIRQNLKFDAVSHVDFSMDKGEIVILTGPSGCGKSTFFKLISGITTCDSGKIIFDNQELTSLSAKDLAAVRSSKISYILQGDSLLNNFTVMENLCLPYRLLNNSEGIEEKAKELLTEFNMEKMLNEYPGNLSGGERRRVAIARAFVHNPLLVIADEPTNDLDEENINIILKYFKKQSLKGIGILISTHDTSCLGLGGTHYVMKKGILKKANIDK